MDLNQLQIKLREHADSLPLVSPYLTIKKLANELGVSVRTIRRWHAAGGGPLRTKSGHRFMYHRDDVQTWLADAIRGAPKNE